MMLGNILPDWNSLDSVRRAHSDLEAVALVFFALLVAFDVLAHFSETKERVFEKIGLCFFAVAVLAEIAAYPYGQRNDALSERIIGSLDEKARDAEANAATALVTSGTALTQSKDALEKVGAVKQESDSFGRDLVSAKKQAADEQAKLADATLRTMRLESQLSWRVVTPEQKEKLRSRLLSYKPFLPLSGLKITVTFVNQDAEAEEYAAELRGALDGLGAEISDLNGAALLGGKPIQGVMVIANPSKNPAANALLNAMNDADLGVLGRRDKDMDGHTVVIRVGSKSHNDNPR